MPQNSNLSQMKIAVVYDHDLIREGMNAVLKNHGVTQVSKFGTAMGLVESLDGGAIYDFYIIDLELPDEDGFVLMEMIRARDWNAKRKALFSKIGAVNVADLIVKSIERGYLKSVVKP